MSAKSSEAISVPSADDDLRGGAELSARTYDNPALMPPFKVEPAPLRDAISESLLALNVRSRLLTHLKAAALPIHVAAAGTTVTLSGEVQRKASLEQAEAVAQSMVGVDRLISRLTLAAKAPAPAPLSATADGTGDAFQDALLVAKIKSKLIARTGATAFAINVEARGGVVRLSGNAPDPAHRDRAMLLSRQTPGAAEVHDLMTIKPPGKSAS